MKSKIFFISNHLRGPKGAAGTRSWQQVKELSKSFDITVAIPEVDPVTGHLVTAETYDGLNRDRVSVKLVSCTSLDRASKISRVLFYVTAGFGQFIEGLKIRHPSCILVMSLPLTSLWVGMFLSRIKGCPLVVDVRDLPFDTAAEVGYLRKGFFLNLAIFAESFALRSASFVVCNSERYKPMLINRGVSAERIETLVIGYDDFDAPSQNLVNEFRYKILNCFSNSKPTFVGIFVGTFGHVVEVETVLEAARLLKHRKDIGFLFVGSGQRLLEYQARAEREGLVVHFTGRVTKENIQPMCRAADFCIYSAKAGEMSAAMLGNKLFDYLGAEKPVIYSGPESAVLDVIKMLNAGLATPENAPKELSQAIVALCEDGSFAGSLGEMLQDFGCLDSLVQRPPAA